MSMGERNPVLKKLTSYFWCLSICVLLVWPAHAVERGKTSHTAEVVCAFRSIGALDPDPKTRNPDDMAQHFVSATFKQTFPGMGLDYEDAKIAMDGMGIGVFYWVNARTHHMDARLVEALEAGFDQVVILGAGFDSRAYRFHETHPDVRFFEIDLPATSRDKQQRVERILGRRPQWVTYVPIDFNTQTLTEVLAKAGFQTDRKAFYIWEGVTNYISRQGVESTLGFVAGQSAPGSQIVFDYMLEDVAMGLDYSPFGARRSAFGVAIGGEPFVFGIDPDYLETYVNLFGLSLLSNIGPAELTRRYLIQSDGRVSGRMAEFLYIAHALVPEPSHQDQIRRMAESKKKRAAAGPSHTDGHIIQVPTDVQAFLSAHSRNVKRKDFGAILEQHSEKFLAYGQTRHQSVSMLQRVFRNRQIDQYGVVLTRFHRSGDMAKIDGYVQHKGFRTPLMITDIIKEADGRWRWYGDQQ